MPPPNGGPPGYPKAHHSRGHCPAAGSGVLPMPVFQSAGSPSVRPGPEVRGPAPDRCADNTEAVVAAPRACFEDFAGAPPGRVFRSLSWDCAVTGPV